MLRNLSVSRNFPCRGETCTVSRNLEAQVAQHVTLGATRDHVAQLELMSRNLLCRADTWVAVGDQEGRIHRTIMVSAIQVIVGDSSFFVKI